MNESSWFVPILTVILGVLGTFIATSYWRNRDKLASSYAALEARVTTLEQQFAVLGHTVQPITSAFQAVLIKQLTHYHTPRLDELLRKVESPNYTLTGDETRELTEGLAERTTTLDTQIDASEKNAAAMLPFVIERARTEALAPQGGLSIELVGVPTKTLGEQGKPT